ncbi:MAG: TonB-dependent receptor [Acidobacteriota bacterium]|nr:MAG: TonB-dependent receptor [Acidobacteriota bacterium]
MSSRERETSSDDVRCFSPWARWISLVLAGLALALGSPWPAVGQPSAAEEEEQEKAEQQGEPDEDGTVEDSYYYEITVTATLTEKDTFTVPQPVSVVSKQQIERKAPQTATDLLRDLPGVDISGAGANQSRPIMRGQRGQRVLLLQDGMRLNNSRRDSDFGEIPALIDVSSLDRLEVVRGPGSVLYGSDAIGGVLNLITSRPQMRVGRGEFDGFVGFRYDSAARAQKGFVSFAGRLGAVGYAIEGSYRDAKAYDAPAGSFGNITLGTETRVQDTGVQDDTWRLLLGHDFNERHSGMLEIKRYQADQTGFGRVDPAAYGSPSPVEIGILYPFQDFEQITLTHTGQQLESALADRWKTSAWLRDNEREFVFDFFLPLSIPGFGTGFTEQVRTNFTDIETLGLRSEASKSLGSRHLLTYGLDYFEDDSFNTDQVVDTFFISTPFGDIEDVEIDNTPSLPNGKYTGLGVFVQDDMKLGERVGMIIGGRYQRTEAESQLTPNLELAPFKASDDKVVGAANFMFDASDNLKIIANFGQAFRSPNLVERLFEGRSILEPAFQLRNPDLEPEESFNIDLGVKYRRDNVYFEATAFRNDLDNGIRIGEIPGLLIDIDDDGTGDLQAVQYINVDELRYEGYEVAFNWTWEGVIDVALNYTHITAEDVKSKVPVADSYSDKFALMLRHNDPEGRMWFEYALRYVGEQDDLLLTMNPIGDVIPSFTVHSLRSGYRLFELADTSHRLEVGIDNLTDELYAEVNNASAFRPEPGRSFHLGWRMDF